VRRPLARGLGAALALFLAVYCAALGYLFVFQRDYVFVPGGRLATPEARAWLAFR
jgi:Na+-transporting NADH:ubiquinone oxidoreductase subunit NqrE